MHINTAVQKGGFDETDLGYYIHNGGHRYILQLHSIQSSQTPVLSPQISVQQGYRALKMGELDPMSRSKVNS